MSVCGYAPAYPVQGICILSHWLYMLNVHIFIKIDIYSMSLRIAIPNT